MTMRRRTVFADGIDATPITRWVLSGLCALLISAALLWTTALAAQAQENAAAALERGDFPAAVRLLLPLAEQGSASAQTNLGILYDRGLGVPQDFTAAARWYRLAADQGGAVAQNSLARLLAAGLGAPQNHVEALKYYLLAADQGDARHQFDLAVMYDNGLGVPKDPEAAAQWYGKAADQGLADAQANLGLLYQRGAGVKQDFAKALVLYRRAAEKGQAKAQNNLALMYTKGDGVAQDYETAVGWFKKAAEQGLAPAMTNLGVMYDNGFGIGQDDAAAIEWYRRAGQQGAARMGVVLEEIGLLYDVRLAPPPSGEGAGEAIASVRAAAGWGDPIAQFVLAHLLAHGLNVERDDRAAAQWYRKAAESGLTVAMTNLGLLYLKGQGVPQDYVLGYMWINFAAGGGQADAVRVRDWVAPRMTAPQINEAQRLASRRWRENNISAARRSERDGEKGIKPSD